MTAVSDGQSELTESQRAELAELARLGRKYKWAQGEARRYLETQGVNIVRSDFYSESPLLSDIESSFEFIPDSAGQSRPIFDNPLIFDEKRMRGFAQNLVPHAAGFDPSDFAAQGHFSWTTGQLIGTDAMSLYAMIRRFRPATVLEIGSGQSSFVAACALRDNGAGRLICIDPEPRRDLTQLPGITFARRRVQEIAPAEIIAALRPGDIMFYDGEHSPKTGNSAVYFYHFVLPYLRPGVFVHVHDVRLPYPASQRSMLVDKVYWTECYLVLAYLQDRRRYRVLFGSEFAMRRFPEIARAMMHGLSIPGGASLWLEVLDDGRSDPLPTIPSATPGLLGA